MKRWIHAATKSQSELIHDIGNKLYDYIVYEVFEQHRQGYYKQVRKQITVNGRKYLIKNTSPYNAIVITNSEGEELFKSTFPNGVSRNDTKRIATDIVNDAYGDATDLAHKIVDLSVRIGYTSYGSNSGGPVVLGEYVDNLREYYSDGNSEGRYFAVMIKAYWSSSDQKAVFSDNADKLIDMAEQFIADGAATASPDSSTGVHDYRYYADVVDSETGEELYADKAISYRE